MGLQHGGLNTQGSILCDLSPLLKACVTCCFRCCSVHKQLVFISPPFWRTHRETSCLNQVGQWGVLPFSSEISLTAFGRAYSQGSAHKIAAWVLFLLQWTLLYLCSWSPNLLFLCSSNRSFSYPGTWPISSVETSCVDLQCRSLEIWECDNPRSTCQSGHLY